MRSFSSAYYRHRCIANEIAVSGIVQGFRATTEREIAQGTWLGGEAGIGGKRPDVLLRDRNHIWWVEVEKSRKNLKDYQALLVWLGKVKRDGARLLSHGNLWAGVIFICTPAFRSKLLRDLESVGWKKHEIDDLISCSAELYSFKDIVFAQ